MTRPNTTESQQTTDQVKPKAFSYVRFSTPEQAQGDSYRRQTELAKRYADTHGLELDTSLRFDDLGVSAFRGRNAEAGGALRAFLTAVGERIVPQGSYLIVESLDRISRQTARKAARTLEDIVEAGVRVVDLSDGGKVYDTAALDDGLGFLVMTIRFMRAHEESAMKAIRLANAYDAKRMAAANGAQEKPFTRMLPAWLQWNDETRCHEVIKNRAEILRDIFAKADAGWSKHRISRALNEAGLEPWGKGARKGKHWHSSYIQKLLTNRAVIGTFTPHRALRSNTGARVRKALDAIEGYWPAVIDRDVFERVESQAKARAARGRYADSTPKSVFAGLLRCGRCGGSVVRITKGDHVYLVCSKSHARAGCRYLAVQYHNAETALRDNARALVSRAPRGINTADIEAQIEQRANEVEGLLNQTRDIADFAASDKSEAARRRLRDVEEQLEAAEEHLRGLRAQRDMVAGTSVMRRLEAVEQALTREPLDITEANQALKQVVSKIVMDAEAAALTFCWHHAEQPSDPIYFVSRHKQWEVPSGDTHQQVYWKTPLDDAS
jgi:DNA invertase Pin-like site-specific DNA recombinase